MKKLISVLLCVVMCIIPLPVRTAATEAELEGDVWDGSITQPTTLVEKDGVYYYEITKCSELAYVAQTGGDWLTYNYILGNNLILNAVELTWDEKGNCTNTEELLEWQPIGESAGNALDSDDIALAFSGNFDGAGYTVTGMYIEKEYSSDSNVGLFGYLHGNVSISNLVIENAYIHIAENSNKKLDVTIGGVCGLSEQYKCTTSISNCSFSGMIYNETSNGCSAGITSACSNVSSCTNYGTIVAQNRAAGIICSAGQATSRKTVIKDCINYGKIHSNTDSDSNGLSGGILSSGYQGSCSNCKNYGRVTGAISGGIMGRTANVSDNNFPISSCENHGAVQGTKSSGGISGIACGVSNSINTGNVTGNDFVGGIVGAMYSYGKTSAISTCANTGAVDGEKFVGGICGGKYSEDTSIRYIQNSYNLGSISGEAYVGGLIGDIIYINVENCYTAASVVGTTDLGLFCGRSDHIWGKSILTSNYYLGLWDVAGMGGGIADADNVCEAKSATELKLASTFIDWDFDEIWAISPDINGGYPYLQWQEGTLSNISVTSVQISETSLSLAEGDHVYLTATVSPVNASDQSITWASSNASVADVTAAGKVTAVSAGTADITVTTTDGGFTAACTVTVTERKPEEYKINSIKVREYDGTLLTSIPIGTCLASVSITNLASEGDTLVLLASYTAEGRYQGLMWVTVSDLPVGATIEVTLPIDNNEGTVAQLKAFTVASFSNLTPLGAAVSFPSGTT